MRPVQPAMMRRMNPAAPTADFDDSRPSVQTSRKPDHTHALHRSAYATVPRVDSIATAADFSACIDVSCGHDGSNRENRFRSASGAGAFGFIGQPLEYRAAIGAGLEDLGQ